MNLNRSPVVALNRAVAVANVRGPAAGIEAIRAITARRELKSYYLLYAVLGDFEAQLNHPGVAVTQFQKALELTESKSERIFLSKRIESLRQRISSAGSGS
jgi:predicted RNA polymerase sigma factor